MVLVISYFFGGGMGELSSNKNFQSATGKKTLWSGIWIFKYIKIQTRCKIPIPQKIRHMMEKVID